MKKISILFSGLFFLAVTASFCEVSFGPSFPPDKELNNVILLLSDLPPGSIKEMTSTIQKVTIDGWEKSPSLQISAACIPGITDIVRIGDFKMAIKYGYFPSNEGARHGALSEVRKNPTGLDSGTYQFGGFNNTTIGDQAFRWERAYEARPGVEIHAEDSARLSFCLGRYAVAIWGGWINSTWGTKDKSILDTIALKCEKKIKIATALDGFSAELSKLITNQGIFRSLQAKLDAFIKHYQKGEYNTALNNMTSFVNELDAQRGKHVSEQAYQTLKTFADTIIANTNSLL